MLSFSTTTTSQPTSGSRVWVRQSAMDASRLPKAGTKAYLQQRSLSHQKNSNTAVDYSETESMTDTASSSVHNSSRQHLTWEWKEAVLVEHTANQLVVRVLTHNDSATTTLASDALEQGHVVLANEYTSTTSGMPMPPDDLISMTHLHEPAVVDSLRHRFSQDHIYTSTGPVLLAVNPFQTLTGLYGESIQKQYWERAEEPTAAKELPPHVYAIADESFRNMIRALEDHLNDTNGMSSSSSCNQSILVSGESGAGKTVTTKFVMKYLAALSQRSTVLHTPKRAYAQAAKKRTTPHRMPPSKTKQWGGASTSPWRGSSHNNDLAHVTTSLSTAAATSIEAQVLQSNPILESFGNARTVRNDNSSRFGKFIELQFSAQGKLVRAKIDTYLLEQVRLVRQSYGERNYHIFYQLLSGGMDATELSNFFLAPTARPHDFKLTSMSATYDRRDGVRDRDTYTQLRAACQCMKFTPVEVQSILAVTAAILHASNLTFSEFAPDQAGLDADNVHTEPVCELLGVHAEDLSEALTAFSIQAGREQTVRRSLSVAQAEKGLEALLKTLYGALFQYLVRRINDSMAVTDGAQQPAASIGVLDIFGFESFQQNSFEQLCINYCNEALQQQFNAFVLKNEQAEYEREGIEWSFIEFPENQDVLDLIEKRGTGILSILDDQCRAPGPSDKAFAINVYNHCTSQTRFQASSKQMATLHFSVQHYAGPVEYTTDGFVEKNRDELPKETTDMLKTSELPFIQELAYLMEHSRDEASSSSSSARKCAGAKTFHRSDSSVGRATVGGQFRRQLKDLRSKIDRTTPHYIRCIKPNDLLVPDVFDRAIVAEQLKCGGILEAIRVARAGFTQHYPHADFIRRYRSLAWKEMGQKRRGGMTPSTTQRQAYRHSYTPPTAFSRNYNKSTDQNTTTKKPAESTTEKTSVELKTECKQLIAIIYNKLGAASEADTRETSPPAKAKTYTSSSTNRSMPSWSKYRPQDNRSGDSREQTSANPSKTLKDNTSNKTPSSPAKWKRGMTAADYLKLGLQMGKTKVFIRHKCFEKLERLRSVEQTKAATKLNSIFRRYLARIAYLPYRNAFRSELRERRRAFDGANSEEKKEADFDRSHSFNFFRGMNGFATDSLVDKWVDSQIRDAIHNPVPRNEWGKSGSSNMNFLWVLDDGIWIKNYNVDQADEKPLPKPLTPMREAARGRKTSY